MLHSGTSCTIVCYIKVAQDCYGLYHPVLHTCFTRWYIVMSDKNADFIQLQRDGMPALRDLIGSNAVAAQIFTFLSQHMNYNNAVVCSDALLQEITGKTRQTVYRARKVLIERGFFSVMKSGNSNVYILNPDLVWSSWRNGKKFCEFEGKILISRAENKQLEDKIKTMTEKHVKLIVAD